MRNGSSEAGVRTTAVSAAHYDGDGRASDLDALDRLRGENLALHSILYGLCMGLCHMSELHREAVVQAMDYAVRTPAALELNRGGQGPETQAFNETISQLRLSVFERYRSI